MGYIDKILHLYKNMKYIENKIKEFTNDLSGVYLSEFNLILKNNPPLLRKDIDYIIKKFMEIKKFKKVGKSTRTYWLQRGFTDEESTINRDKNRVNLIPNGSPMQIKYWTRLINEKTNDYYTEEEAKYKIKSQRKFNIEYWITRGYSVDEGLLELKNVQIENSKKAVKKSKENPDFYLDRTWNQYKYWMKKHSMSEHDAKLKVSELQKTIDEKKLIEKYGYVEGIERYNNMCKNMSIAGKLEGYISRYGATEGAIKYAEKTKKITSGMASVSKESLIFFIPIYKKLRATIERNEIFWGIGGSNEYFIWDSAENKIFFYDFVIPQYKIILEYHGKRYNPNPSWSEEKWNKWNLFGMSAEDKRKLDLYKKKIAENNGYKLIEIFSDDVKKINIDMLIDEILTNI
jgi:hypothetical protein